MSVNGDAIHDDPSLEDLINNVAEKQGFDSFKKEIKAGTIKGDNYLGTISKVKMTDEKRRTLNLVVKQALQSEEVRKQTPVSQVFAREVFMYQTTFPVLKAFENEKGISNVFSFTPKCYATSLKHGAETIILEDLSEMGYKMWNRRKPMDENHVTLILQTFGHFHALSLAMKQQEPELFTNLAENLTNVMGDFFGDDLVTHLLDVYLNKAIEALDPKKHESVIQELKRFRVEGLQFMKDVDNIKEDCVITHGDCWCNNFMFKYGVRYFFACSTSL